MHMKQEHPDSCYETGGTFRWKLPLNGNQRDYGIIKHESGYYLFEMFYDSIIHKLYFCLQKISESSNCTTDCMYEFKIEHFDRSESIQKEMKINVTEFRLPIEKRSNTISLCTSNIRDFLNTYRHFKWALEIICNNA